MKKENKFQKKLSLKKVQLMKINEMITIQGGNGYQQLNFNDEQEPTPPVKATVRP